MYNYELKIIHFKTLGLGFDKKNNTLYDKQLKINPLILFSSPFHLTYLVVELEVLCSNMCVLAIESIGRIDVVKSPKNILLK